MANEIQTVETAAEVKAAAPQTKRDVIPGFGSIESFEALQRMSKLLATIDLLPAHYHNNLGNCAIALNMATRMNADVMMVAQNLYVVYGNPAWSSKFMIATFNQCGKYSSIHYKETGKKGTDSWGCIAWAKELATGEILEGPEVTIAIAKAEGWYSKNGSKWQTMPAQMLRYRAAAWFIRTTAPELSMGLQTVDEVVDSEPINITEEINANANREEFIPEAPAPAITPGHKVTTADLDKAEKEAVPVETPAKEEAKPAEKKEAPAKKAAAEKQEAPQQETLMEGPGF